MYKNYHKNPRNISTRQLVDLEEWLEMLGDLSGIVINKRTNEIISGNQRSKVININECEIITDSPLKEVADEQGTIGTGVLIWKGYRYVVRFVDWDEKTSEMANVVANKAGGEWDKDILNEMFEKTDLMDWGFMEGELKFNENEEIEGEIEFGEELLLEHNYVVLYFDNELDWNVAKDKLGLKRVKSGAVTSKSQKVGIGRVINGSDIIRKL